MRATGIMLAARLCGVLIAGVPVFPDEPSPQETPPAVAAKDDALRAAIRNGLECLAKSQNHETGMIGQANPLASTSLAGMAFLSNGSLPGRGKYGHNIEMAVRWILDNAFTPSGYLQYQNSNMYSHGYATLFLAEVYGTIPPYMKLQPKVLKVLKKSVALIEKSQGKAGGWVYDPTPTAGDSDLSVTITEATALRAARNAGIAVDKRVLEKNLKCIKNGQNSEGGFCYRVGVGMTGGGGSTLGCTAASVCVLQALGLYDDPATKKGLEFLKKNLPKGLDEYQWWYYGAYYVSQAMFMSGAEYWNNWWPQMRDMLLKRQQGDGSWLSPEGGREYGTAVALIVLQIPYRYLPLYQEGIETGETKPQTPPAP